MASRIVFSLLFGSDKCNLPTKAQIKEVIYGCSNECDKKCVIDNHEVEIIHQDSPQGNDPSMWDSLTCPNPARAGDLCSGRVGPILSARSRDGGSDTARSIRVTDPSTTNDSSPQLGIPRSNSGFP